MPITIQSTIAELIERIQPNQTLRESERRVIYRLEFFLRVWRDFQNIENANIESE